MTAYTSIQIGAGTRKRLSKLKRHERETYDELLNALINLVPSGDNEGEYTDEFRASLLRALTDIRERRTHSHEEVKRQLGIK